ncbi:non-ribosomal peptide synthetase [Paenibacillus athensensis]|uniref:Carrier domain-containing protein n=1 Tax=Paenibacillus athensensis TaxID=1967502 RepID=A0A4Y8PWD2_9BACL|nr:non-ribosomal peptide synthetase [Paenibacillus athensensis]MCD1260614.1 non-ribosomal peptide synthetase [Paenibacillus athensensis]
MLRNQGGTAVNEEVQQILSVFNHTEKAWSLSTTVHELFEEQAGKRPTRTAIRFGGKELTYGELNRRANRLAHFLMKKGVGRDSIVMVMLERSELLIETILAIWKAGGAYIPLDVNYPDERVKTIHTESQSRWLLSLSADIGDELEASLGAGTVFKLDACAAAIAGMPDENPRVQVEASDLAYVIFTSGSTGTPKGAMVEHAGMLNHIYALAEQFRLHEDSVVLNNASPCFDISVWQMFTSLTLGAVTAVYDQDEASDPALFVKRAVEERLAVVEVVPSLLYAVLDYLQTQPAVLPDLEFLLVTGEPFKPDLAKRWLGVYPHTKMVNAYGPAEAADDITLYVVDAWSDAMDRIPIGKPIANLRIYIVDEHMQLCPVGVKGEICVAGIGVGRGYLNNPRKTAEVFVEDHFAEKGGRLYKTGDIGCWLPDGNIEFFGRKDYQVKVRGFRIELGEIETALERKPGVRQAVAVVREEASGDAQLVAYYTSAAGEALAADSLKEALQAELPYYMVPAMLVHLAEMPLNANGKIDRKQLPAPVLTRSAVADYAAPSNAIESEIAEVWEQLFQYGPIGVNDDFLDLGGHSLLATQLVNTLHEQFGVRVALRDMLTRGRTIKGLSEVLEELLLGQLEGEELESLLDDLDGLSAEEIDAMLKGE